jgi:hypothetical protein
MTKSFFWTGLVTEGVIESIVGPPLDTNENYVPDVPVFPLNSKTILAVLVTTVVSLGVQKEIWV